MKILFEDGGICVIDKPSGVVVNDSRLTTGLTVQQWFAGRRTKGEGEFEQKGGLVHRLDKDTSGVMILAKTQEAYERLKSQFLERKTKKQYIALVHGVLKEKEGIISRPIDRHPVTKTKFAISDNLSRTAVTEWRVVDEYSMFNKMEPVVQYSIVELRPLTGRTHQLRVHLQYLGHPIVSDSIYGFKKMLKSDLALCPRLFLHAKSLEIDNRVFESKLPPNLQQVLDFLVH